MKSVLVGELDSEAHPLSRPVTAECSTPARRHHTRPEIGPRACDDDLRLTACTASIIRAIDDSIASSVLPLRPAPPNQLNAGKRVSPRSGAATGAALPIGTHPLRGAGLSQRFPRLLDVESQPRPRSVTQSHRAQPIGVDVDPVAIDPEFRSQRASVDKPHPSRDDLQCSHVLGDGLKVLSIERDGLTATRGDQLDLTRDHADQSEKDSRGHGGRRLLLRVVA